MATLSENDGLGGHPVTTARESPGGGPGSGPSASALHPLVVPDTLTSNLISDRPPMLLSAAGTATSGTSTFASNANVPQPSEALSTTSSGNLRTAKGGGTGGFISSSGLEPASSALAAAGVRVLPIPARKYFLLGSMLASQQDLLMKRLRGITDYQVNFSEYVREMVHTLPDMQHQRVQLRVDLTQLKSSSQLRKKVLHCHVGAVEDDNPVQRCTFHVVPVDAPFYNHEPSLHSLVNSAALFYEELGFQSRHEYAQEGVQFCRFITTPFRVERLPVFVRIFSLRHIPPSPMGMSAAAAAAATSHAQGESGGNALDHQVMQATPFLPDMRMIEVFAIAAAKDREADVIKAEVQILAEEVAPLAQLAKIDETFFLMSPAPATKGNTSMKK